VQQFLVTGMLTSPLQRPLTYWGLLLLFLGTLQNCYQETNCAIICTLHYFGGLLLTEPNRANMLWTWPGPVEGTGLL